MFVQEKLEKRIVKQYETSGKAQIFQLPLNAFPGFWVYAYLVLVDEYKVLIDVGSNFEESNRTMELGFKDVSEMTGEEIGLKDLTHVFITHGHIDHFGGLVYVRPRTQAEIWVHELDRRNLSNFEERTTLAAMRLEKYLYGCGVNEEKVEEIMKMYMLPKTLYRSVEIDRTYGAGGMQVGPFEMLHVPGHCAGMVVIKLGDVLFSADHVLSDISPHQAPERLTLSTGLGHYLASLSAVEGWAGGVRLTLGSHKAPIEDLEVRIKEIRETHIERLSEIIKLLNEPRTIGEISRELFGEVGGYNVLLALEETGAHVEYLYQYGMLSIENVDEIRDSSQIVPIHYRRLVEEFDPSLILCG